MLRAFKAILAHPNNQDRCRRPRRCAPSLPELASCLEDRVLLSAAGGGAHAADVARNLADTKAGKEVTNLFESILQTNPTGAQLTQSVHELRSGMSVAGLRKDLTAEARMRESTQAMVPVNVVINADPSSPTTVTAAGGATGQVSTMPGVSGATSAFAAPPNIRQVPVGFSFAAPSGVPTAPTTSMPSASPSGGMGTQSMSTNSGSMSVTMSPTSTMTGMGSSSGMAMSPAGSMSSTPTASDGIGTPTMLPISPLPIAPITFTPTPTSMTM